MKGEVRKFLERIWKVFPERAYGKP